MAGDKPPIAIIGGTGPLGCGIGTAALCRRLCRGDRLAHGGQGRGRRRRSPLNLASVNLAGVNLAGVNLAGVDLAADHGRGRLTGAEYSCRQAG